MTEFFLSRRTMIVSAIAGLFAAGGVDLELQSMDRAGLLRRTLERLIGPFHMAKADFARFETDFAKVRGVPKGVEVGLLNAAGSVGLTEALAHVVPDLDAKLQFFERSVLTEFVLGTGIRDWPGTSEPLGYNGPFRERPCTNPFARFD